MRRHHALTAVRDRFSDTFRGSPVQPNAVGQIRCAEILIALALGPVASNALRHEVCSTRCGIACVGFAARQ